VKEEDGEMTVTLKKEEELDIWDGFPKRILKPLRATPLLFSIST
jgi:hypothetical protein